VKKNFTWQPTPEEPLNIVVEEIPQSIESSWISLRPLIGLFFFALCWFIALNFKQEQKGIPIMLKLSLIIFIGATLTGIFSLFMSKDLIIMLLFFALLIGVLLFWKYKVRVISRNEAISQNSFTAFLFGVSIGLSFCLTLVPTSTLTISVMIDYLFWLAAWETTIIILFFAVINLVPAEKIDSMLSVLKLKV
jgi:hypothetical protein